MPKFTSTADFQAIPVHLFVVESGTTPPVTSGNEKVGMLWNDSSIANNSVLKYFDGDEWVRCDGGGDIPNGMIVNRHVAADANIDWSKINHPTNLATTDDVATLTAANNGVEGRVTTLEGNDAGQSARQIAVSAIANAGLNGSFVTLSTSQTISGDKTFTGNVVVPVGDNPTEAVQLSQLTSEATRATGVEQGLRTDLTAETNRAQTAEQGLRTDLTTATTAATALTGRVSTAETNITGLRTDLNADTARLDTLTGSGAGSVTAAVSAEHDRAVGAESGLSDRVAAEVTRATAAEGTNAAAVTAEVTRATAAEGGLNTRVNALEAVDYFTQAEADAEQSRVNGVLATKADLVNGVLRYDQIPALTITSTSTVADTAARDALDTQEGDIVIVTGTGTFIKNANGDWVEIEAPSGGASGAALASEIARAEAAESALAGRVTTLESVDNFTQAEFSTFNTALTSRLNNADSALQSEVTRATAAESANSSAIATEVTNRTAADDQIRTDFAAADTALGGRIDSEITRATAAETALNTAVSTEATTRASADTALAGRVDGVVSDLSTETANRVSGDNALGVRIDNLQTQVNTGGADATALAGRVTAAEGRLTTDESDIAALQTADSTEASARQAADTALQGLIDTLNGDASTVGSVAKSVAQEATARAAADTALNSALNGEIANRTSADTALSDAINGEATARIAGDNQLRTDFTAADTALASTLTGQVGAEHDRAVAAEAGLLSNVNTRALDTDVVHKAGAETVSGVKTFTANPQVPGGTGANDAVNFNQISALVAAGAYDDSDVRGLITTAQSAADAAQADVDAFEATKGQANGLATLDANGKVPITQMNSLNLTNVSYFATIGDRDAATGNDEGDVAIVGDNGSGVRQSYIWDAQGGGSGTGGWVPLSSPADVTEAELAAAVSAGIAPVTARIDALGAGAGLTKTGDRFDVIGTAGRILVGPDNVDLDPAYVGQGSITTVGTITTGTWHGDVVDLAHGGTGYAASSMDDLVQFLGINVTAPSLYAQTLTGMVEGTPMTVTHGLGGEDVVPSVRSVTTGEVVIADVTVVDANTVTVTVDASYTNGDDLRITLVGGPVETSGADAGRIAGRIAGRKWGG